MDFSWLNGGSSTGTQPRGVGVRRGGSDPPLGDPGEAPGCWGERCCPGMGEAGERPQPFLPLREEKEAGAQRGRLDRGHEAWLPVPWATPLSVTWQESLALL